jgi:ribosomal protein S18 acetylase RimI-like enzyme
MKSGSVIYGCYAKVGDVALAKDCWHGEAEILGRGHRTFRLRVLKSNAAAIKFYHRQGWQIGREFPHERFPVTVLEMVKSALQSDD